MRSANQKHFLNQLNYFVLHFSFLFSLFLFCQSAYSAGPRSCNQIFGTSSPAARSPFSLNQIKILEKIKKSGIEMQDLRIVSSTGDMADVNLLYKSKNIGFGSLDAVENQQHLGRIHISFISVQDSYSGKGLGLLMYLALAKAAYMNGYILESSYDLNLNSERLWDHFVTTGLAKKMNPGRYEFKFEVLSSVEFQTAVDHILSHFNLKPGERLLSTGHLQ